MESELKLYNAIKSLALTHMFEPRLVPNDITVIVADLKALNKLFTNCASNVSVSYSSYVSSSAQNSTSTIKEDNYTTLTKNQSRKLAKRLYKSINKQFSRKRSRTLK